MRGHTVKQLILEGKSLLKESGANEYSLDCHLFMMEAINITRVQLFTKDDYKLSISEKQRFEDMVQSRMEGQPTQYILGKCQFMGLEFRVAPGVLIPRPDTEVLVETVLECVKKEKIEKIIDIGTGSGCIAISLNKFGVKNVSAVDVSEIAINQAMENAKLNDAQVNFIKSDLFKSLGSDLYSKFDAIVSNPPYIARKEIDGLMREVRDNEPLLALDGGEDGLDFYRIIIKEGRKFLREGGLIFFEIGHDQKEVVCGLLELGGYSQVNTIKDLAGLDRVVFGRKIER